MKKIIKRLLSKKGITLVEILVVLVVTSILLGCAMGMLTPVNNLLNSIKGNAHLDTMCDTANEYIRGRLQNATAVSIMGYSSSDSSTLTAIQQRVKDDTDNRTTTDYALKVNALAVLKNPDGFFRLYDFESVTEGTISGLVSGTSASGSTSEEDYGVFNSPFYENTSYVMTFTNAALQTVPIKDSDGNVTGTYNTTGWIKVISQSFKDNAGSLEATNQPKTVSFKVLGGGVDFSSNADADIYDDTGKTFDFTKLKDGFVVIYVTKDFNNYSPT